MLIPLALVFGYEKSRAFRWREASWFAATALLASAICFFPVWSRYGLAFFTFYENHTHPGLATIVSRATIEPWGALGLIGLTSGALAAYFLRGKEMDVSLCKPTNSMVLPALWLTIFLYLIAYVVLPDQAGYLLPIVPAFLFITARFAPRRILQLACVGLLFSAWIDFSPTGVRLGAIVADHRERERSVRDVTRFVQFTEEVLPGRNVVVVGGWQPMIDVLETKERLHNDYRGILLLQEMEETQKTGSRVAYTDEMIRAFNFRVTGVDLVQGGALDLRTLRIAMNR